MVHNDKIIIDENLQIVSKVWSYAKTTCFHIDLFSTIEYLKCHDRDNPLSIRRLRA